MSGLIGDFIVGDVVIHVILFLEIIFLDEFAVEEVEFAFALVLRQRREDHGDGTSVEAWRLVHLGHGFEVFDDSVEDDEA